MAERLALVTGAARGIGRAIALALAEDGRAVAVADLLAEEASETVSLVEAAGGRAAAVRMDVTDGDSVAAGVAEAEAALGRSRSWSTTRAGTSCGRSSTPTSHFGTG